MLSQPGWNETAVYVQDQFRRIGVRMELLRFERGVLAERRSAGTFEAVMMDSAYIPSSIAANFGPRNGSGYRSPQLNALIELATNTADPDVTDQAYRQMSDILRRDVPVTFLIPSFNTSIVHNRVKGLSAQGPDALLVIEDLWLEDPPMR